MTDLPPPTLRLSINSDALTHNWRALDTMSGSAQAGAAVKANCYGLGVDRCVPALRNAGCEDFFVAHWSEVPAVLRHIPAPQLSVLHGVLNKEEAAYARAKGVIPVIDNLRQARLWQESGGGLCHLMVDTGINRLGISPAEITDPAIEALDVDLLMSHLACADEDSAMNARQLESYRACLSAVSHKRTSLANSAGIALGKDYAFDLTRPGLSLYGGLPRAELDGTIRQVARPEAALIQVKELQAGDKVGYNATFIAPAQMKAGVVSLGYADGILRSWAGGHFLSGETKLPILGKVSMDMIVLDLSDASELSEGDWVELPYALPDAARQTSLSQYELLTILGRRFG